MLAAGDFLSHTTLAVFDFSITNTEIAVISVSDLLYILVFAFLLVKIIIQG